MTNEHQLEEHEMEEFSRHKEFVPLMLCSQLYGRFGVHMTVFVSWPSVICILNNSHVHGSLGTKQNDKRCLVSNVVARW